MKAKFRTPAAAVLALAIASSFGTAVAAPANSQDAPTAAEQKKLDAARKQLDVAAKEYAELVREYDVERVQVLRKPVIGVVLAPDPKVGVHIAGVTPGGAAAAAGLKSGDRIVAIDGKSLDVANPQARVELARTAIGKHDDKSRVQVGYVRDGVLKTIVVTPESGDRFLFIDEDAQHDWAIAQEHMAVAKQAAAEARAAMPAARRAAIQARVEAAHAAAPEVRREIIRIRDDGKFPVIAEAMRWNGLNLASVDANLGKYFGTDKGVLVLSTGPELKGLQPGDVIRSVDSKQVGSPREVMEALRGRDTGSKVAVGYLRDRKSGTAQVTVPEPMQFRIPPPPAPPAPPAPPTP